MPAATPVRVVYIDDSESDLRSAVEVLTPAGFEVRTHTSCDTAARDIAGADIVLVDYHMPGMHGGEVVQRLRCVLPPAQRTLFYLYTSDRSLQSDYRQLGFDGQVILKGNREAFLRQLMAAQRAVSLPRLVPNWMRRSSACAERAANPPNAWMRPWF